MKSLFPDDYLNGHFIHNGFAIPTLVAQQIALNHSYSKKDIKAIQSILWASVVEWLGVHAPQVMPIVRDYPMEELIVDSDLWSELHYEIVDVLDAVLIILESGRATPFMSKAFGAISMETIYAALILLGSEVAAQRPADEYKAEFIRLSLLVNKSYVELTTLDDGPFVTEAKHQSRIRAVKEVVAKNNRSMGKSGGDGKGKSYEPIRELLEKLINEARPKDMEEAANMCHDPIVEFDRFNKALFSKTGDTHRAIKRQISLLNKAGRLYKKF